MGPVQPGTYKGDFDFQVPFVSVSMCRSLSLK